MTSNKRGISHVMIIGDFNFPDIDYEYDMVKPGLITEASKFFGGNTKFISCTACACSY